MSTRLFSEEGGGPVSRAITANALPGIPFGPALA
jgi:hypothetical protein